MKKNLLWAFLFMPLFFSCNKLNDILPSLLDEELEGTSRGPEVQVGNGKAWAWISTDKQGAPSAIGITITKTALNSLPWGDPFYAYTLKLPLDKLLTRFDHCALDWNPNGHEPENIYGIPHFDFHFYFQPLEERMMIPPYPQAMDKFDNYPHADYLPANYFNGGGGVPMMGSHWVDLTSPELDPVNPKVFDQTFIYGTYDGEVTFIEPMITLDFINNTTSFVRAIPQPKKYEQNGYFPTQMRVRKSGSTVTVSLEKFVFRTAS